MKRTTLALDEDLLRELKARAAREGTTLQRLVNALIRQALSRTKAASYRLQLVGWKAETQPGVDLLDRAALYDRMDGR